jgi:GTP-binding protein
MVDGVPCSWMPRWAHAADQFVLKKSLELHLKPIVGSTRSIVQLPPRRGRQPHFDLFCELNATDEQLDFPIVYASGKQGWAVLDLDDPRTDMKALLETIVHRVLPPIADAENPFQMLVTMLDYDSYMGRIGSGRIYHGTVKLGDPVVLIKRDGTQTRNKVTRILRYVGPKRRGAERDRGPHHPIAGTRRHVGETLRVAGTPRGACSSRSTSPPSRCFSRTARVPRRESTADLPHPRHIPASASSTRP